MQNPGENNLAGLSMKELLVFIGGFAYRIYLFHSPILQIFSQYLLQGWRRSQESRSLTTVTAGAALS